uniref:Fatty acid desaturase domain-containing protein n=1 Tax=Chromera velia CCMP2878 TaxID=1169474 RepID=A0A0G4HV85_9ALVE|mmetsp:Transcript_19632/g.39507  ORF Transcript_19632/g.39507 Transcript_19632/m.39507 type:complete len:382 (+) Transcript_19632:143-1288(+)|eukprot:Cvel_8800.t1-p1 / transcript=Cvel_8800.t1 / gene=Cvel_8800 / organism=Chromera_velia_CCMP2878 / gene_product=hypothetical protein / transcript_product=hypothetical protein / location=Cvel_scaffold493:22503-24255(+) / protein_length=381 / sequence_SO=supercontig / SO=protein_coding / is_pseudo=false
MTSAKPASNASVDTKVAAQNIRAKIRVEEENVRASSKLLSREADDLVGFLFLTGWLVACVAVSALWATGRIPTLAAIVLNALAYSVAHEQEHDLIHNLYFKTPAVQHVVFFLIWIAKSNMPPWWRKKWHLHHHLESGQKVDVEERIIGIGLPIGPKRILITLTSLFSSLVMDDLHEAIPDFSRRNLVVFSALVIWSNITVAWHAVSMFAPAAAAVVFQHAPWLAAYSPFVIGFAVCIAWPNMLRQFCLVLITTWCHYYGDIPEDDVFYQVQVLNHPVLLPFQLFCWNFGATHVVHHFVTRQPFWVRTLVYPLVVETLREEGIPVNDLSSILRNNRFFLESAEAEKEEGEKEAQSSPKGKEKEAEKVMKEGVRTRSQKIRGN